MAGELIRREALERIIHRAAELQAGEHDIGEGLTEPDVLALGQEVGIPPRYLRQALLEERTRGGVAPEHGVVAWVAGPVALTADRVVPGDAAAVERVLTGWMEREESLQVKRRQPDRTSWEPRVGAVASIQRALGAGGRSFALAHATEVAARVVPRAPHGQRARPAHPAAVGRGWSGRLRRGARCRDTGAGRARAVGAPAAARHLGGGARRGAPPPPRQRAHRHGARAGARPAGAWRDPAGPRARGNAAERVRAPRRRDPQDLRDHLSGP